MLKISHFNTFYFLRNVHVRYVNSLFKNIQKHEKLAYFLRKLKLHGQITQEFLELRMRNFQGIVFIWTQTYREIFESASVYL